ncbi:MAG: RDD family protein [Desulfofustis sp. PB-SRB1]|jgi:uncharacterized RDD family membrane protein YckC|nr:RDD family protein [Desulfofustis sp. PB-SRB1]MBM1001802.1 RDD family protein [Desulfofustis sp. PB-SRB1]HBH29349.1 RDD family protein [Desulfofustis sp.]
MDNNILPINVSDSGDYPYAGFWRRFGAFWLDFVIVLPWVVLLQYFNNLSRLGVFYTIIPSYVFFFIYSVYTVKRWGGTPGKLLVKIVIKRKNGKKCDWREAILRESVLLALGIPGAIASLVLTLQVSDQQFASMTWMEFAEYRQLNMPEWHVPFYWGTQIWIWSEFLVLLIDKRKRALHDYVAGTVVIQRKFEKWAESG